MDESALRMDAVCRMDEERRDGGMEGNGGIPEGRLDMNPPVNTLCLVYELRQQAYNVCLRFQTQPDVWLLSGSEVTVLLEKCRTTKQP